MITYMYMYIYTKLHVLNTATYTHSQEDIECDVLERSHLDFLISHCGESPLPEFRP